MPRPSSSAPACCASGSATSREQLTTFRSRGPSVGAQFGALVSSGGSSSPELAEAYVSQGARTMSKRKDKRLKAAEARQGAHRPGRTHLLGASPAPRC